MRSPENLKAKVKSFASLTDKKKTVKNKEDRNDDEIANIVKKSEKKKNKQAAKTR